MAGAVGGKYGGVHKAARIVMINGLSSSSTQDMTAIARSFTAVFTDVQEFHITGGVLCMSFGSYYWGVVHPVELYGLGYNPTLNPLTRNPWLDILERAHYSNLALVVAAGNSPTATLEQKEPTRFGGVNSALIVVGGTEPDGSRWEGSTYMETGNHGILSVYAPAYGFLPSRHNPDSYAYNIGTSVATAIVSGMIAYLFATVPGTSVRNVKTYIIADALRSKGMQWPQDRPQYPVRGRVALGRNLVPCTPPNTNAPTAALLQYVGPAPGANPDAWGVAGDWEATFRSIATAQEVCSGPRAEKSPSHASKVHTYLLCRAERLTTPDSPTVFIHHPRSMHKVHGYKGTAAREALCELAL